MIILGSTGSIGVNTLSIAKEFSLHVDALVAGVNTSLLNEQIQEFKPKYVCVADENCAKKVDFPKVHVGIEGILEIIECSNAKTVVNALVGFLGLAPTLKTLQMGKKLALANKESLVVAGHLLDCSKITPIDSEHFALWYLLSGRPVSKMTITASGGAFRDTPLKDLKEQSPQQALQHPNWSMGKKITIDSATMTNKLFELLEAKWLFDPPKIDAIIEPKSLIHAMVDFKDGSSTAQLALADMRLPIAFALMERVEKAIIKPIDLTEIGSLEFRSIDVARYPIWEIKDELLEAPQKGVVVNAANEIAVEKFFAGELDILQVAEFTKKAFRKFEDVNPKSLDAVFEIDKEVRRFCEIV